MKLILHILAAGLPLAAIAEGEVTFSLHTSGSPVAHIRTADDFATARAVAFRAGDTIKANGKTIVDEPSADGEHSLTSSELDAGGVWTLTRTAQGGVLETATVTVRHSIYGTLGSGTVDDPAELVDAGELSDLVSAGTAGDGFAFTAEDGTGKLVSSMSLPVGYRLASVGDGLWQIVTSPNGNLFTSNAELFSIDSRQAGPDRKVNMRDVMPLAYSNDNWTRSSDVSATLRLTSPSGTSESYSVSDTGSMEIPLDEKGVWTVSLVSEAGEWTAHITVTVSGLVLIVK